MLFITASVALLAGLAAAIPTTKVAVRQPLPQYCGGGNAAATQTSGDPDSGPGVRIRNADSVTGTYFLYENSRDTYPWKYISIAPGGEAFVSVCPTFQDRVVRGNTNTNLDGRDHNLGTWAEIAWKEDGHVFGDISLLRGCDGAVEWEATDGSGGRKGFSKEIVNGAPAEALCTKDSGARALCKTVDVGANMAALAWEKAQGLVQSDVYIEDGPGIFNPVISSTNGVVKLIFYAGTY